jgi:hypothetical protein
MSKAVNPPEVLHVRAEENLNLLEPMTPPSLAHKKEENSTKVTILYLVGILTLIAASVTISALSPFWLLGQLSSAVPDARFAALVEQLKSINTILGNVTSGLLTALGIGIGYFFRRSGTSKD